MASTLPNMGLRAWDAPGDNFSYTELVANWTAVDQHDHSSGKGVQIPTAGLANLAVTGPKIAADAVDASKILDGSVGATELASGAVTSSKIGAGAVTAAGIEAQQAWQTIALSPAGWSAQLAYYKDSLGVVRMRGNSLTTPGSAVTAGTTLCTLPAGYRPGTTQFFTVFRTDDANLSTSQAIVSISAAGAVVFVATGAGGAMSASAPYSFSGVTFRAEG